MTPRSQLTFAALIATQAAHSIEEYAFALWEVLPIAARVNSLVSSDLPTGFAVVNASFVAVGVACYLLPIRSGWPSARGFAWAWSAIEFFNGVGHLLMALGAGGYFPGFYTAPFLLVLATVLGARLRQERKSA